MNWVNDQLKQVQYEREQTLKTLECMHRLERENEEEIFERQRMGLIMEQRRQMAYNIRQHIWRKRRMMCHYLYNLTAFLLFIIIDTVLV